MDKSADVDAFSRFTQVSRETITSLKKYENLLLNVNKSLNLIGKSTENNIWRRHFLDSVQVIDFIDKNSKSLVDLGSGAGLPGIILALVLKDRKISTKVKLLEKSPKKANFLRKAGKELNLNIEVINKSMEKMSVTLSEDVLVARAFKPLKIILPLIHSKAENWKFFFIYLGKTGENELLQASKSWNIKYKQRMSITNSDSSVIEINNLEKR